jgi:hypothetical protein
VINLRKKFQIIFPDNRFVPLARLIQWANDAVDNSDTSMPKPRTITDVVNILEDSGYATFHCSVSNFLNTPAAHELIDDESAERVDGNPEETARLAALNELITDDEWNLETPRNVARAAIEKIIENENRATISHEPIRRQWEWKSEIDSPWQDIDGDVLLGKLNDDAEPVYAWRQKSEETDAAGNYTRNSTCRNGLDPANLSADDLRKEISRVSLEMDRMGFPSDFNAESVAHAINTFGNGQHPMATPDNLRFFKREYVQKCIDDALAAQLADDGDDDVSPAGKP